MAPSMRPRGRDSPQLLGGVLPGKQVGCATKSIHLVVQPKLTFVARIRETMNPLLSLTFSKNEAFSW